MYNQCFLGWAGVLYCMYEWLHIMVFKDDKWSRVIDWCDTLPSFLTQILKSPTPPQGNKIKSTHFQMLSGCLFLFCSSVSVLCRAVGHSAFLHEANVSIHSDKTFLVHCTQIYMYFFISKFIKCVPCKWILLFYYRDNCDRKRTIYQYIVIVIQDLILSY